MMRISVSLIFCLSCVGCLGRHHNGALAAAVPHPSYDGDVLDYPTLSNEPLPDRRLTVRVAPIGVYHRPLPAASEHVHDGSKRSNWGFARLDATPEEKLPQLLSPSELNSTATKATLYGEITDFQWYEVACDTLLPREESAGGRLAMRMRLVADDGRVLFEGQKVTQGRAGSADTLYRAHALAWLRDKQLLEAVFRVRGGI